jgi:hypothetical protein
MSFPELETKAALDTAEAEELRMWIRESGQVPVADTIGVNPGTLARALAGLEIRRGSVGLIRVALAARYP